MVDDPSIAADSRRELSAASGQDDRARLEAAKILAERL
jgi:hypothetical protein